MGVPAKEMESASRCSNFFMNMQRKNNIRETINVRKAKYAMLEILNQIRDTQECSLAEAEEELIKLIKFFFLTASNRMWSEFEYKYNEYYESLEEFRESRRRSSALQRATLERKAQSGKP